MKRILVAEDDRDIADLIAHYLQKAGFLVEIITDGAEVLPRLRRSPVSLLVLDLMLPGMDGLEICRAARAVPQTATLPIIILTARGDESDRIVGLELGADDYVTKPFSPKELVARVRALLRRVERAPSTPLLEYGDIRVDLARHAVQLAGRDVPLTPKEFLLLEYLIQHQGRTLSRDVLLSDVWGYVYTGGTRTVDVHIRRLREKLPLLADRIVTVKQFGYELVAAGDRAPQPAP